jgi:hypothetical protein
MPRRSIADRPDRAMVVIADDRSADHWRVLLRLAGLLPASAG